MISRRSVLAGLSATIAIRSAEAAPYKGIISIIDLFAGDSVEPAAAAKAGVIAIIHKATEGTDLRDKKYSAQC